MVDMVEIAAEARNKAGKGTARALRREGKVPGVLYGEKKPPLSLSMEQRVLNKLLEDPKFFTQVCNVDIDGEKHEAIARDVQLDPVTDVPVHIDFLRVGDDTRIVVHVPIQFINQEASPGLKRGAVLNVVRYEVEVECRVADIPDHVTCDLTGAAIGDTIPFSKLEVPEGVTPTITDRDFTIATIAAPSALRGKLAEEAAAEESAAAEG